jgi:hypothetical protein
MEVRMKSRFILFLFVSIITFSLLAGNIFSQNKDFVGTRTIEKDGKKAIETIPERNNGLVESLDDHLLGVNNSQGEKFVLGGTVLWYTQDVAAIANVVAINSTGNSALTGWGLNNQRATLYSDVNSNPIWDFPTGTNDPFVDISGDGSKIAATGGTHFYMLNSVNGNIDFQFALPDSFYASAVSVARDGSMAVVLANALGNSTTYRAYAFNLTGGTPSISWTFDVQASEVTNWAGVNFSADGSSVAITGRYHLYVFNSIDGTLIWDHFVENTESKPAISGDGQIVATADNSGFVQVWHFDSQTGEYYWLWQYHVPVGLYINWASSVGISADGNTIIAGSLLFYSNGYDGSIMCFDTYGNGTPKWIYSGLKDLVDDISVSDDGRVAAAVTWGDFNQATRQDLFVFDVATGQSTFQVSTPGSFFTCDISPDGKRVFAGGKATHAREFGSGGRIYLCDINLGGGDISGNVNLTNTSDDSGVLVKVTGTGREAITAQNGDYLIENIPAGTHTVSAGKPGYNFGLVTNVTVNEGGTTSGVDFSLNPFTAQPPVLSASDNEVGEIILGWILPPEYRIMQREIDIAKTIADPYPIQESTSTKVVSEKNQSGKFFETDLPSSISLLADSVYVYRSSIEGGPYSKIGSVSISQLNYTDTDVFPLRRYYYVVNIVTDIGQSSNSNEAFGQVSDSLLTFSVEVPEASIPTIDGVLSPGEWDDAIKVDISDVFAYGGVPIPNGSAIMYLKFDDANDMLYIAGEDFLNPTLDDNEGFGFYIDDNNDNIFNGIPPYVQEGNFWAYWHPGGANLRFRDLPTYVVDTLFDAQVEFTDVSGHLQGEVAIPMGFYEGYQLQVFGPDKIVGLGAFLIGRQAGVPIYHGWWPQTMLYVYDPISFGDVKIDVSLNAPPQAPSNISVTRQGEDLLLTWDDPTLGLNNEPLLVPPTIVIYKNDEMLTTLSAGVESYLDNDVHCVAWYEYKFRAFIVDGSDTLSGPISSPVGEYACEEPTLVPISYDDGNWNTFYAASFTWEKNKFAVRFTPSAYPIYVRSLKTTVNSNDAFDFTIQEDNGGIPGGVIAGPYRVFDTSPATVGTIIKNVPGTDPPEITQGDFWVVINWLEQTPGSPGIGGDSDPPIDNRSMYYLTSSGWVSISGIDIMVTAYVSDQPVGVEGKENGELPLTFELKQNYPNPFNPSTIITYQIPQTELVTLEVYNALGEKVRTLVNNVQEAGYYQIDWDGKNNFGNQLSSGIYLYRITAGNFVKVMKMVLLR